MSAIAIALNLLLAALLGAALMMGWRLNARLKRLRDTQDGFAKAVTELNAAAARAQKGLAELRAASDEAMDLLSDRITKGRDLAAKLEGLTTAASKRVASASEPLELHEVRPSRSEQDRLGALLAETQRRRAAAPPPPPPAREVERPLTLSRPRSFDDDLFEPQAEPESLGHLRLRR